MADKLPVRKGDYVIVVGVSGTDLIKVLSADSSSVEGLVERNCHIQELRSTSTCSREDVVLNLGSDPYPGFVHGHDTRSLYRGRKVHQDMGDIHFFYKPGKDAGAHLWSSLSRFAAMAKKQRLPRLVSDDIVFEVRPDNGETYAGRYRKPRSGRPVLEIRPEKFEYSPATHMYVISHEMGHHLWFNYVRNAPAIAAWIKLFDTTIGVQDVESSVCSDLYTRLVASRELPSEFRRSLPEEEVAQYKHILNVIRQRSAVGIKELDVLVTAQHYGELKKLWPVDTLKRKELAPAVSEYATKNVHELFAESFAFFASGRTLPKQVSMLLDKTLSLARDAMRTQAEE